MILSTLFVLFVILTIIMIGMITIRIDRLEVGQEMEEEAIDNLYEIVFPDEDECDCFEDFGSYVVNLQTGELISSTPTPNEIKKSPKKAKKSLTKGKK